MEATSRDLRCRYFDIKDNAKLIAPFLLQIAILIWSAANLGVQASYHAYVSGFES